MGNILDDAARRPLPSLAQWLDQQGNGDRAPDFDEMEAMRDLAERTILQSSAGLPVEHACFLRLWQGFLVASVELCNIETKHKVPTDVMLTMLPRVMATAAMYAFASIAPPETAFRDVAKLFTEEFRAAAKTAADGLEESN